MFVAYLKEGQFEELLHIPEPWFIDRVDFGLEAKQLGHCHWPDSRSDRHCRNIDWKDK